MYWKYEQPESECIIKTVGKRLEGPSRSGYEVPRSRSRLSNAGLPILAEELGRYRQDRSGVWALIILPPFPRRRGNGSKIIRPKHVRRGVRQSSRCEAPECAQPVFPSELTKRPKDVSGTARPAWQRPAATAYTEDKRQVRSDADELRASEQRRDGTNLKRNVKNLRSYVKKRRVGFGTEPTRVGEHNYT